jgi:hypothetical protein
MNHLSVVASMMRIAAFALCWSAVIVSASADETRPIFAQKLVDDAKATRPNLVTIGIHAKPPTDPGQRHGKRAVRCLDSAATDRYSGAPWPLRYWHLLSRRCRSFYLN